MEERRHAIAAISVAHSYGIVIAAERTQQRVGYALVEIAEELCGELDGPRIMGSSAYDAVFTPSPTARISVSPP